MPDKTQVKGSCKGYKRGAIFELVNGRVWEQTSSEYEYNYQYRPEVEIDSSGSRGTLRLEGMEYSVDVKRVS